MYQVYACSMGEKGGMSFVKRGEVATRREAVSLADAIRREMESSSSRKKAGIWDGDRLVQPVF